MITKQHESGQVSVSLIKHSVSEFGDTIATYELEYPRFIHGELMTHRVFSRNAMSSRAVPVSKMIEQVRTNPAMPIHWGKNQAGMQADTVLSKFRKKAAIKLWNIAANVAATVAAAMDRLGAHKQIVNRILEPFQRMKAVVTATEWDNFFYLRCHKDAQPEIKVLAELMRDCVEESEPQFLKAGEWHVPYVDTQTYTSNKIKLENGYFIGDNENGFIELTLDQALKVSASCCAQVSYRLLDNSLDKALIIYDKLIESKPEHSSPFEHQAKVMSDSAYQGIDLWDDGITHIDKNNLFWSGNFKGWIQYRQLLGSD